MESHLSLLILLDVRTSKRLIEDLASFLQQVSTVIQIYRKMIQRTNLQPLPLQHSNLPQRPISIPKLVPRQPNRPLLRLLAQRHSKQRPIARYQQLQRRAGNLVEENVSPLLVAETRLRVVEVKGVGLEGLFPGCGGFGGGGCVVGFDVPDKAQGAVGLEGAVQGVEGCGGGEPVECLLGGC